MCKGVSATQEFEFSISHFDMNIYPLSERRHYRDTIYKCVSILDPIVPASVHAIFSVSCYAYQVLAVKYQIG